GPSASSAASERGEGARRHSLEGAASRPGPTPAPRSPRCNRRARSPGTARLTLRRSGPSAPPPDRGTAMPAKKSSAEKAPDAGPGGVMAIRLVLQILELLGKRQTVGVTELANALGTTKARVFRHLRTLADTGFAEQDPGTERYMAGPRLIGLARLAGLTPDEG